MESASLRTTKAAHAMFASLCFTIVLEFLEYEQQVWIQGLSRTLYNFTIPRFLRNKQMTVRPDFVFFDFSSIKSQMRTYQN